MDVPGVYAVSCLYITERRVSWNRTQREGYARTGERGVGLGGLVTARIDRCTHYWLQKD